LFFSQEQQRRQQKAAFNNSPRTPAAAGKDARAEQTQSENNKSRHTINCRKKTTAAMQAKARTPTAAETSVSSKTGKNQGGGRENPSHSEDIICCRGCSRENPRVSRINNNAKS
jgi:hypothetical protein